MAFWSKVLFSAAAETENSQPSQVITNAAQVLALAARSYAIACAVQVQGVVLWTNSSAERFILQDDSGTVPVEVDYRGVPGLEPGEKVRIVGRGLVRSGILQEALVENDRLHSVVEKSGAIYLSAGRHAIRADWFNGPDRAELEVDYEGPGLARQRIP